jgi:hypothetical protein
MLATDSEYDITESVDVTLDNWRVKLYVTIRFEANESTLGVNDDYYTLDHLGFVAYEPTSISIGGPALIDCIGFYDRSFTNKQRFIDDDGGYLETTQIIHGAQGVLFDKNDALFQATFDQSSFIQNPVDPLQRVYGWQAPTTGAAEVEYISIKVTNETLDLEYSTDAGQNWVAFRDLAIVTGVTDAQHIIFRYQDRTEEFQAGSGTAFNITVTGYADSKIDQETFATLDTTGAVYPLSYSDSIVNCPDGVALRGTKYDGTWILDEADDPTIPGTLELAIRPWSADYSVFLSDDTEVSSDAISGATVYVNAVEQTTSLQLNYGEWHYITIEFDAETDATFSINDDLDDLDILFFNALPGTLAGSDIEYNWRLLNGAEGISQIDTVSEATEGTFAQTGIGYKPYAYAWGIISSG